MASSMPDWPRGRATMVPITDRELVAQAQAEAEQELRVLDEIDRYRLQGAGLAAMAIAMWTALDESGLTREERLAMVTGALHGR